MAQVTPVSATNAARATVYTALTEPFVRKLRERRASVETVLRSHAVDETLRDLRLLSSVFDAFVAPIEPSAAILSSIRSDLRRNMWTSPNARVGALFKYDGILWTGSIETSCLDRCGDTYENVTLRLPTDGCLLRSDADALARGDILPQRRHHGRTFYEMTHLGATALAPISNYMLALLGAAPGGEPGVDLEVLYCGKEDRLDCVCVDRRQAPVLVRTVQVFFEPGWPAARVPPNHPGPWAMGGAAV